MILFCLSAQCSVQLGTHAPQILPVTSFGCHTQGDIYANFGLFDFHRSIFLRGKIP